MASGGLKAVHDALTFAYVADVIDIEEFVFLHDYNRSKPVFPYWKFGEFNLEDWDDVEYHTELRFAKNDLHSLLHCLQIPDRIVCQYRTVWCGMQGMCILLKRLSYPCRYTDMVARFGRNPTELYLIFNTVLDIVYATHHHHLESWEQPFFSPDQLHNYAQAVHNRGAKLFWVYRWNCT